MRRTGEEDGPGLPHRTLLKLGDVGSDTRCQTPHWVSRASLYGHARLVLIFQAQPGDLIQGHARRFRNLLIAQHTK